MNAFMRMLSTTALMLVACGPGARDPGATFDGGPDASAVGTRDASGQPSIDAPDNGCAGVPNCESVYAHSNDTLYVVDLTTTSLTSIGPFQAPSAGSGSSAAPDIITDLAVAPDGTIWVVSETALYTASATDGHVTLKGSLSACGTRGVALTFTPNGKLYTGDFKGAICEIDTSGTTPVVKPAIRLSGGMALSGDMVAIGNGTVFGTLYKLSDASAHGTQLSNVLGSIDVANGQVTLLGATGYPKLFGTSFAHGKVIGFTHDGTGRVVQLDPSTGAGTLLATFNDPLTAKPISFAGAGVNALVSIIQ